MRDPALVALGESLRAERVAAGLTQEAAAKHARIGRVTLVRWERGEQPPRGDLLERLRGVYQGATGGDVSGDTEQEPPPLSAVDYGRALGRLELLAEWLGSMDPSFAAMHAHTDAVQAQAAAIRESVSALRQQLDRATKGVAGLVAGGILGGEAPPPTPPPTKERPVIDPALFRTRDEALGGDTRQAGGDAG